MFDRIGVNEVMSRERELPVSETAVSDPTHLDEILDHRDACRHDGGGDGTHLVNSEEEVAIMSSMLTPMW